jgi:hypothetical protein
MYCKPWLVIFRKSWTQQVTRPHERFATQAEAHAHAAAFNRANPDATWNAEVAIVHHESEKLRA